MTKNIQPFPICRVKFEGLTGELEMIAGVALVIYFFDEFLLYE